MVLDREQITEATKLYDTWWQNALPVSQELIAAYDALPRLRRSRSRRLSEGPPLPAALSPTLGALLAESGPSDPPRSYWMKAAYHRPEDEPGWWHRGWISDRRSPPYSVGDLIVLYLGGPGSPRRCPAILKVRSRPREDGDFVERHGRRAGDRRWPHVTEASCVYEVPIEMAPRPASFGIDTRSTQPGYRGLTRGAFEGALRAMASAHSAGSD